MAPAEVGSPVTSRSSRNSRNLAAASRGSDPISSVTWTRRHLTAVADHDVTGGGADIHPVLGVARRGVDRVVLLEPSVHRLRARLRAVCQVRPHLLRALRAPAMTKVANSVRLRTNESC